MVEQDKSADSAPPRSHAGRRQRRYRSAARLAADGRAGRVAAFAAIGWQALAAPPEWLELDADEWRSRAVHLGAWSVSPALARCIDGQVFAMLRGVLGEACFEALMRAVAQAEREQFVHADTTRAELPGSDCASFEREGLALWLRAGHEALAGGQAEGRQEADGTDGASETDDAHGAQADDAAWAALLPHWLFPDAPPPDTRASAAQARAWIGQVRAQRAQAAALQAQDEAGAPAGAAA